MAVEITDEEIIALYKNGNKEVFKNLINRYTAPLYNFAARLTDRDQASDIVQDTFIKAWKNLEGFNSQKASFKTWLFTIARNTVTDFLRKKKSVLFKDMAGDKETENDFADNIADESPLPVENLLKLEDEEALNMVMSELRPSYREILVLHYQEDMTFDEIGKILDKPLNTVKSQHRRAILELRDKLK